MHAPAHPPRAAAAAGAAVPAPRPPVNPLTVTLAAACCALAASGAVPRHDLAFSAAWPAYLFALNRWRFDRNAALGGAPPGPLVPEPWVRRYAAFAGVLGLLVPAAACAFAASSSHPAALAAAAPHLYLTCAQVLCECFSSGSTTAALPRMLVPIGFNTYRMGTLITWVAAASAAGLGPAHVALAGANLVFWAYNLFGFLLPNMLPRYLDPKKCAT